MNHETYIELYDERLAIMIIDGKVEEGEAKLKAFSEIKDRFVNDLNLSWSNPRTYNEIAKLKKETLFKKMEVAK